MFKKIILWSHPRSRSTALERAFIERDDFYVIHEPFSMPKYKGMDEEKLFKDIVSLPESLGSELLHDITQSGEQAKHIFIKDFPYHSYQHTDKLLSHDFIHTFLVREPHETILSWQNINPDFEEYELGYTDLLHSIQKVKAINNGDIFIIESEQLVTNTRNILQEYCKYIGIPFKNEMCCWSERKKVSAWNTWDKYHKTALETTGFVNKSNNKQKQLSERNMHFYHNVKPVYDEICDELLETI